MLRLIFTQIWNKRRNNAGLFIELCLVFCLLWYIMEYFFVLAYNLSLPEHRNLDNTWQIQLGELPQEQAGYKATEADSLHIEENYFRIVEQLRLMPEVEAVAILKVQGSPRSGNFYGIQVIHPGDSVKSSGMWLPFDPRGDFFRVFRYTDAQGKAISMADYPVIENGVFLSENMAEKMFKGNKEPGKQLLLNHGQSSQSFQLIGLVGETKRFEYLRFQPAVYTFERVNGGNWQDFEIAIRTKPGVSQAAFKTRMLEKAQLLKSGNFYLKSVTPYRKIEQTTSQHFGVTGELRSYTTLFLFFLINIFLCILGSFWYRISKRKSEIGLHMAMGASKKHIRRLFYGEGLVLLTGASFISLLVEVNLVWTGLVGNIFWEDTRTDISYLTDSSMLVLLICHVLTWIALAACIGLSIAIPLTQTAHLQPADALHED